MHISTFAERYLFIQVGQMSQNLESKAQDKFPPLPLTGLGQVNCLELMFSFVTGGILQETNIFDHLTTCGLNDMEIHKT